MNKKIGKFKVWQLIAAGVAIGIIYYIYTRNNSEEEAPEYGYLEGTESPLSPAEGGGAGSAGAAPGSGISETLGVLEALRNAGLIPSNEPSAPEREEVVVEKEGPEPKTNGEVKRAQLARRAAQKAEHKLTKELNKAKAATKKLEHQHHQKHNSTGGSAHTPHAHHAKAHPAHKVHTAKKANKQRSDRNRGTPARNKKRKVRR